MSENSQPEKETKAKIPASTNFPIQGIKELPDFKYSSSPILILQKVATMLSKSVGFSPVSSFLSTKFYLDSSSIKAFPFRWLSGAQLHQTCALHAASAIGVSVVKDRMKQYVHFYSVTYTIQF